MGLFKKNKKTVITDYVCPSDECTFSTNDSTALQRHIDWKHPELTVKVNISEKNV